ncbi:MAG TPA: 5-dehydro-2-deoxygluconokinase [Acidimicrobiales bacterium]|nr:5-dehydro-2-deoxygluconokinase [Acidimicrobiales bacterium]
MSETADHEPRPGYDVLTMGRVGVDIYPLQPGPLEDVKTFEKFLGGSATNVAVAAARLARRSAVITRVGEDPFGRFVRRTIRELGVDDAFVGTVPGLPTPVTFCELFPPDRFPIYFYRFPKAPDLEVRPEELDPHAIRSARIFWCTVTGLSAEPSRAAHRHALALRSRRGPTVLDLDYRASFWSSPEAARAAIDEVLPMVTIAVGNREECAVATGANDPERAADTLLERGVELVVVKAGPDGVMARTAERRVVVPPVAVDVVNGLGAGDAFGGALCHGLLAGWDLERALRFANVAGAIVASRLECSTAMPTAAEVERLLGSVAHA